MCFFFNDTSSTDIYTLSLHDALPIFTLARGQNSRLDIPRLPNGHPDFQGTWFKVGGFGLTGAIVPGEARGAAGRGASAGGGGGARGTTGPNEFFMRGVRIPYLPQAIREKTWRQMNQY